VTENKASFALNAVTLGVTDFARSVRFYEALGLKRKMRATGDAIAFFDAGGLVLALFAWTMLAEDAALADEPRPQAFRGTTLARMCRSDAEVDAVMAHALSIGARLLKAAHHTSFGGYSGYFADPDGHPWEAVRAPGFSFAEDGRVILPE
jgi:catechol 2,3-dioxygenase-like lactoylglutathione lyase family enzyme